MQRSFAAELCAALARERYAPAAWARFWAGAWRHSRQQAAASARRRASSLCWIAAMAACGLGVLWASGARLHAPGTGTWRWGCWLLLVSAWLYLHQGMAPAPDDGAPHRLGLPNGLSFARLALAPLVADPGLLSPRGTQVALRVALVASVALTDLADGQLARRLGRTTRLGRTLDPLADLALMSWLGWGLLQAGAADGLLLGLVLLRWPGALLLALTIFFATGRRPLPSSVLGKATTAAALVVLGLLALQVIAGPRWLSVGALAVAVRALEALLCLSIAYQGWRSIRPGSGAEQGG